MNIDSESGFPVVRGRLVTNTRDLNALLVATMTDVAAGRITTKEANAINREAREVLKIVKAVLSARKLARQGKGRFQAGA
jgi:hypothetical protein